MDAIQENSVQPFDGHPEIRDEPPFRMHSPYKYALQTQAIGSSSCTTLDQGWITALATLVFGWLTHVIGAVVHGMMEGVSTAVSTNGDDAASLL